MSKETRYIEWASPENLKTKLLLDKKCTRVVLAEHGTPNGTFEIDPKHGNVLQFLDELEKLVATLKKNVH